MPRRKVRKARKMKARRGKKRKLRGRMKPSRIGRPPIARSEKRTPVSFTLTGTEKKLLLHVAGKLGVPASPVVARLIIGAAAGGKIYGLGRVRPSREIKSAIKAIDDG